MDTPLLNPTQAELLSLMLETLIPAAPQRGLPSGAKVRFAEFAATKGILPKVVIAVDAIGTLARERHSVEFGALEPAARLALLTDRNQPNAMAIAEMQTYLLHCYYQNPIVVSAIGMEPKAPFPEGYQVEEGDLLLLEPVFLRGKLYRDV